MSYRKLSDNARRQAWQAHATGTPMVEIAEHFGVSYSCINAVVNEERHLLATIRSARRRLKRLHEEKARAQAAQAQAEAH